MLASLKNFLNEQFAVGDSNNEESGGSHELELATAALAVDIARADNNLDDAERRHIVEAIARHFSLTAGEAEKIMQLADSRLEESVSLYNFTRQLNDGLSRAERIRIIRLLWDVAWADDELHKHEEFIVRKVADLLYVSHSDYIRAKLEAEQARASNTG